MRVLLIGGNSYIAKHFAESLKEEFELKIIKRDDQLKDYFDLSLDDFTGYDVVINFAAIVHQKNASEVLYETYNEKLVIYLADLAIKAKVKQFIQLSTVSVYGEKTYIDHDTKPSPNSFYGEYKLKADEYLLSLNTGEMMVSILRPTVVYGKYAPGNMNLLIKLIRTGVPLPLKYKENKRAILCVENLTSAIEAVVRKKAEGIFLLKDKEMPSIFELSKAIKTTTGSKSLLFTLPKWCYTKLLNSRFSTSKKLFGNLEIDDKETIEILGEYRKTSWYECIGKML